MKFLASVKYCFINYNKCSGEAARASRSQYWYWYLFTIGGIVVMHLLDEVIFHAPLQLFDIVAEAFQIPATLHPMNPVLRPLSLVFTLLIILPTINVAIRRMHDINRSG